MIHDAWGAALLSAASLIPSVTAFIPGLAFDRFFTIWLENQDAKNALQNPDFLSLSSQGVLLTNYYSLTHPSEPNYIASVGGDYFGLDNDDYVTIPGNVSTVVDLLDEKGITWKEYSEDIPSPGYQGSASGTCGYVRKHNSLISYDSISSNRTRLANIVGFDSFNGDVGNHTLPQLSIIIPTLRDDGLSYGVNWTQQFLQPLLSNDYFTNRTLILLTFDENESHSEPNRVASVLLEGAVPSFLHGTNDTTFYTHYSMLATLENNFGLPTLGRYDVGANVFGLVANHTGYTNNATIDISKVKLNKSYPGYLNSAEKLLLPAPNPYLVGAGGVGALQSLSQMPDEVYTPYLGGDLSYDGESGNLPVYKVVQRSDPGGLLSNGSQPSAASSGGKGTIESPASRVVFSVIAILVLCYFD